MNADLIAYCVDDGRALRVPRCPNCKRPHIHGRGSDREPDLGHRTSHCRGEKVDYRLVLVPEDRR